jgi:hypothetical protein
VENTRAPEKRRREEEEEENRAEVIPLFPQRLTINMSKEKSLGPPLASIIIILRLLPFSP